MVRVTLPPMLQELYRSTEPVPVEVAATIGDLVGALEREFPGITGRLCEADGRLRPFLALVVGNEMIGRMPTDPLPAPLDGGGLDVWFLAAVAGG